MDQHPDVIIPEHISLANARKNIIWETEEPYLGQRTQYSEWAIITAFSHFKVGERVPYETFFKVLVESQTEQELNHLIELGLIEALWDGEQNAVVYRAKT